jgi:hypothetical protein
MKRARFTQEQIIAVLKEHETGVKTAGLDHVVIVGFAEDEPVNEAMKGCLTEPL